MKLTESQLNAIADQLEPILRPRIIAGIKEDYYLVPKVQQELTVDASECIMAVGEYVCNRMRARLENVRDKARHQDNARVREICVYVTRAIYGYQFTLGEIGQFYGGRDHSSMVFYCKKVKQTMRDSKGYKETVEGYINDYKELHNNTINLNINK